jgi:hypothetical protein
MTDQQPGIPIPPPPWSADPVTGARGGYFELDDLCRAWSRTGTTARDPKTHIARSEDASRAICGTPIAVAVTGGTIPGADLCGLCGLVWDARMKAIEADPWEQF